MLSPVGQTDLAMRVHEERMSQIRAFMVPDANERGRFLAKVSTSLEPAAFPPLETIFGVGDSAAQIYFLERGLVSATNEKADLFGSVKQSGSYFGLDALVPNARHRFGAQTLTFAVTFSLLSTVLHEVLNSAEYPQTRQRLRTHCIKYHLRAFCRHIVHLAKVEQLICKDGVTLRLGERVFPSKAALEEYKALLKKAPHPKIYNDLRSKVLKQIYMMKFSRASHNNQAELHKFIGPGISFRHKAVRISLREGTEHIISHPDEVQPSARGDGADDDIGSEPPPKGKPRPTKKDHGSRNATHAGNSDEVMVELEQMKRQLEDMRSGIVSELDSRFQEKLDSRFERMENLILELATK
jgi:CRP-like cAMP-binding protein